MEPKKHKELDYRDLSFVEASLSFWSKKGIQGFIRSGLASDFVKAIRSHGFDMEKTCKILRALEYFGCAYDDEVSLPQALQIISLAPTNNTKEWNHFFGMLTTLSANSKYFEEKDFSWVERDSIRKLIGLEPINPIYPNVKKDAGDIVCRRTGHCSVWVEPEKGYRYATDEEVSVLIVQKLDVVVMYLPNYGWTIIKTSGNVKIADVVGAHSFFHNNVFYIPLVKL